MKKRTTKASKRVDYERPYIVYSATNTRTGKKYVGYTSSTLPTRRAVTRHEAFLRHEDGDWKYHSAYYEAIREDVEHFLWEYLETFIGTRVKAGEREQYWMKQLGTMYPNGYNQKTGGHNGKHTRFIVKRKGAKGRHWKNVEPEQREKFGQSVSKAMSEFYADPVKREKRAEKMRKAFANRTPEQKAAWLAAIRAGLERKKAAGTMLSDESREKMRAAKRAWWEKKKNGDNQGQNNVSGTT